MDALPNVPVTGLVVVCAVAEAKRPAMKTVEIIEYILNVVMRKMMVMRGW